MYPDRTKLVVINQAREFCGGQLSEMSAVVGRTSQDGASHFPLVTACSLRALRKAVMAMRKRNTRVQGVDSGALT